MIHIACNIDNNYIMQCCTTLESIMYNNKNEQITFHIIAFQLSDEAKNMITNEVKKYHQTVFFINILQVPRYQHLQVLTSPLLLILGYLLQTSYLRISTRLSILTVTSLSMEKLEAYGTSILQNMQWQLWKICGVENLVIMSV